MAESRAEVNGVGDKSHGGHVVTARSCCLEMLLCNVVWIAAQASRMAVGGWSVLSYRCLMNSRAWYPGLPVDSRMNGTSLMRVYLSNFFFSSHVATASVVGQHHHHFFADHARKLVRVDGTGACSFVWPH